MIISHIKNLFNFNGRITRSEWWFSKIFNMIFFGSLFLIGIILGFDRSVFGMFILGTIVISFFIANSATNAKRLHDVGLSGWKQLGLQSSLICIFYSSQPYKNQYGFPKNHK